MTVPLHVYGVVEAPSEEQVRSIAGVQDEPVRVVAVDDLAAVVSQVDDAQAVGRAALMAHARVLEEVAERVTVLPTRFPTLVADDDEVRRRVLQARADFCRDALHRLDGTVQVTVKGYHDEDAAIREVLACSPELASSAVSAAGLGYAQRVHLGEGVAAGLERLRADDAALLLERLRGLAVATAVEDVVTLHQFAHLAFLVSRQGLDGFGAAVSALQQDLGRRARLRYLGPQPPYSFLGEERPWA